MANTLLDKEGWYRHFLETFLNPLHERLNMLEDNQDPGAQVKGTAGTTAVTMDVLPISGGAVVAPATKSDAKGTIASSVATGRAVMGAALDQVTQHAAHHGLTQEISDEAKRLRTELEYFFAKVKEAV